jgi:hypothetical protein
LSIWLLVAKLRKAMVDRDRYPLNGLMKIDESSIPFRTKDEPKSGGQGRSHQGKMMFVGAVEAREALPEIEGREWISGRIRLRVIEGYGEEELHPFIEENIAPGSTGMTDRLITYESAPNIKHEKLVIGDSLTHEDLPLVHLQSYLDEYVFRFKPPQQPAVQLQNPAENSHESGADHLRYVDPT